MKNNIRLFLFSSLILILIGLLIIFLPGTPIYLGLAFLFIGKTSLLLWIILKLLKINNEKMIKRIKIIYIIICITLLLINIILTYISLNIIKI